jgi:hypothetical protein
MMSRDFHRLTSVLQSYLLALEVDDPQISSEILRQKWLFQRALIVAHVQLKLYSLGIGTVSCGSLLNAMRTLGQLVGDVPELLGATAAPRAV